MLYYTILKRTKKMDKTIQELLDTIVDLEIGLKQIRSQLVDSSANHAIIIAGIDKLLEDAKRG